MSPSAEHPEGSTPLCELAGVRKNYPMGDLVVQALKGVSVKIYPGEFTAFAGPSGSGKSTVLNCIGCLDRPTEGKVYIEGHDVATLGDNALGLVRAKRIGFIFQSFNLIPVLTAFENIEYPLVLAGMAAAQRRRRVDKLLDAVGLTDRARNLPGQLSGGQRQRVAIARALARKPRLVIADEPTANLDSQTGASIIALLRDLQCRHQVSFVFSSHDRSLIDVADDLIVLRDGAIESVQRKDLSGARTTARGGLDRSPAELASTWDPAP